MAGPRQAERVGHSFRRDCRTGLHHPWCRVCEFDARPDHGGTVLWGQVVAAAITIGYCAVATFILLKILDVVMGLRVSQEGEVRGLDMNEHGEEGYIFV